jgi:hypothetical protein
MVGGDHGVEHAEGERLSRGDAAAGEEQFLGAGRADGRDDRREGGGG